MFKNKIKIYNYLTILISIFPILGLQMSVVTIIIWSFFSFFIIDNRVLGFRFLEKNIPFLLFPLFMIVNKDFIFPDTLKKSLYGFIFSNLMLASYIWIIILSKGYSKTMAADNYYNPILRNIFSDVSGIHLPYLGILFVFSSLILLHNILLSVKKITILNTFRLLAIGLLLFSVVV